MKSVVVPFFLSSAVTGVFDEKLTGARPTAVDMEI